MVCLLLVDGSCLDQVDATRPAEKRKPCEVIYYETNFTQVVNSYLRTCSVTFHFGLNSAM